MYFGLMKRGASFMAAFFGCIFASAAFNNFIGLFSAAFGLLIPVLWFVAFFDFWRYPRMTPEELAQAKDEFLIPQGIHLPGGSTARRVRAVVGVVLILAGGYQLYQIFLYNFMYEYLHSLRLIFFFERLPALLGGIAVILIGLLLIFWKSRQLKKEADRDEG